MNIDKALGQIVAAAKSGDFFGNCSVNRTFINYDNSSVSLFLGGFVLKDDLDHFIDKVIMGAMEENGLNITEYTVPCQIGYNVNDDRENDLFLFFRIKNTADEKSS